jgi:hypothetical protein
MWGSILSGFTISAWINGRSIRRYIGELTKEESKASRELIHESMTKILTEMARSAK